MSNQSPDLYSSVLFFVFVFFQIEPRTLSMLGKGYLLSHDPKIPALLFF
jgi:hypothetical protein